VKRAALSVAVAFLVAASNGWAAGPLVPSVGARRSLEQLEAALKPELPILTGTHKFFCFRLLPTTGEEAIVMVRAKSTIPYAEQLLRAAGVAGTVELRPQRRWEQEMYRLAETIKAEVPPALRDEVPSIGPEVPFHFYECIDVRIALPLPEEASPAAEAWANGEIERYGYDRVTWKYEQTGITL
jgi:hypothetical protein